jgi:hypothetical protein
MIISVLRTTLSITRFKNLTETTMRNRLQTSKTVGLMIISSISFILNVIKVLRNNKMEGADLILVT